MMGGVNLTFILNKIVFLLIFILVKEFEAGHYPRKKEGNLNMLTHHLYKNMCLLLEMASMGRRRRSERSNIVLFLWKFCNQLSLISVIKSVIFSFSDN
jgi:hypothetical protein